MIYYVPICIILAILGTVLVNPAFYYAILKKRKEYKEALKEFDKQVEEGKVPQNICKSDYSVFYSSPVWLIIGQIVLCIITFLFASFILYFQRAVVISYSTILAYLWIPALAQLINLLFISAGIVTGDRGCFNRNIEDSMAITYLIIMIAFFIIPSCIGIHKGIYNYLYPYEHITFMEDNYQEYPTVDEEILLDKANLASGSLIQNPIYRNGNWIYPVINGSSHVNSSGYLVVDSSGRSIIFVKKDISYSPWIISSNHVNLVARRNLPSAVLFGKATFQIDPETGDIYFCKFYGDYACFRAGRNVKGAMLINATTGECTSYRMNEIPSWVTGISF